MKPHQNRTAKKRHDKDRCKHRNLIERLLGRIKQVRRVATRSEKIAEKFIGFVWLAAMITDVLCMSTRSRRSAAARFPWR